MIGQIDLPTDGVLSSDASFVLALGFTEDVSVLVPRDPSNTSLNDLVVDVRDALATAGVSGLDVDLIGQRIRLASTELADASVFVIAADPLDTAVSELGLAPAPPPQVASIFAAGELPGDGVLSGDATFQVSIDGGPLVGVTVAQAATLENVSRANLIDDIQSALDSAGVPVTVELFDELLRFSTLEPKSDAQMVIESVPSSIANLELGLSGTIVSQPNLALAVDVSGAEERIRLRSADWNASTMLSMSNLGGTGLSGLVEIDVIDGRSRRYHSIEFPLRT